MKRFAVILSLASCSPTPTAISPMLFTPFNTIIGIGSHGSPGEAVAIRAMNMHLVRVTYYVANDSPHARELFRARCAELMAEGHEVLVVVHDFPDLNRYNQIATIMAQLAYEFPWATFQVGNEWDARGVSGEQYAELMKVVVPSMRYAVRGVRIVGMGMATTDGRVWAFSPDENRVANFTKGYLVAEGPMLDAWCIHAYGLPLAESIETRVWAVQHVLRFRMPLWITEVGMDRENIERAFETGRLSQATIDLIQINESLRAVAKARQMGVDRMYFYQYWTDEDDGYGWVNRALQPRPIVRAMAAAALVK